MLRQLTRKALEHDGLARRMAYTSVPAKVEYDSPKLAFLNQAIRCLSWVQKNQLAIEAARALKSPGSDTPRGLAMRLLLRPAGPRRQGDGLESTDVV